MTTKRKPRHQPRRAHYTLVDELLASPTRPLPPGNSMVPVRPTRRTKEIRV